MKPHDIDALVSIFREAIESREKQIRADAANAQAAMRGEIDALKSEIATLRQVEAPKPVGPSPEQIADAVKGYMLANPVPVPVAPDPIAPTSEQIAQAVEAYSKSNPVKAPEAIAPTPEQIADAVQKHMKANPVPVPKAPDAIAPTPEQIADAVAKHMDSHPVEIPSETLDGMVSDYMKANPVPIPTAPEAIAPTDEQIAQAVVKHLTANPPKQGDRGLDAIEIDIAPRIDLTRRHAKGTYAQHDGGLWRARRDTSPGDDPAQCGWDVVVRGIKSVEVHELTAGEIAIKTILTGGESHVTKAHVPTFADTYQDVWRESFGQYAKGHTVTHKGSVWLAKEATSAKPGDSPDWKLIVKAGRDGKDINVVKLPKPETYSIGGK